LITVFGRETPVELDFLQIKKLWFINALEFLESEIQKKIKSIKE
jgi:hypothetical protein